MDHEWNPPTPDELRQQAAKLRMLATFVFNRELAQHLREQATELLAQADMETHPSG
jgi:hypothetical protein